MHVIRLTEELPMKYLISAFAILFTGAVLADYALPPIQERWVLLLDVQAIEIEKHVLTISEEGSTHRFSIDPFWMQDRIWSTGICVGVDDSDSKSAVFRIKEVQKIISQKPKKQLLVELVRITDQPDVIVTYLKLFDPEVAYKRYYPKRVHEDSIAFPFQDTPKNEEELTALLAKASETTLARLNELKKSQQQTTATP